MKIDALEGFEPENQGLPDASDKIFDATGLIIPAVFKDIYARNDGAKFETYVVRSDVNGWMCYAVDKMFINIYRFYSVEETVYIYNNILENCRAYGIDVTREDFFLRNMIPFTDVDATNPLCVACSGPDLGKIYLVEWWFHHQNEFTIPFPQQLVADSLDDLLKKMSLADRDDHYQKATNS